MFSKVSGSDKNWDFSAIEDNSDEILHGLVVETESVFVILLFPQEIFSYICLCIFVYA